MKLVQVSDLHAFLSYLDNDMDVGSWGFRGVASEVYDLIPSIGRSPRSFFFELLEPPF